MLLLLLPLIASAQTPVPPPEAPVDAMATETTEAEAAAAAAAETQVLQFGADLNVQTDLMLQGLMATQSVAFTVPRAWELTGDPTVELHLDHSHTLIESRSSLTIRVNDQAIGTVALGTANATRTVLTLTVPRDLLAEFNTLQLQVVQHVDPDCEDPFDPSLWTRIARTSSLTMPARRLPIVPELLTFPFPFHDERGYGPTRLTLVSSGELLPAQLSAVGELGLALGRFAAYRRIEVEPPVRSLAELQTNGLAVGVVGNDPIVTQLVTRPLARGEGLVAVVPAPHDPTLAILVVAGADIEGLAKAVEALTAQDRYPVLSGPASTVSLVKAAPPPPTREVFRPVPRGRTQLPLRDIGFSDTTVRGYYAEPVQFPLVLEGDAVARPGSRLRLRYAHSELVNSRVSAIEVRLNGVVLRSRHLDDAENGQQLIDVELPIDVLTRENEVEVFFHLFPEDFDACRRITDRQLWATVFASSELVLPRDNYALMPDLSRLRTAMWPFSLDAADGGTVVVTSDKPTPADASAVLRLAAEFGRISVVADPSFKVVTGAEGYAGLGDTNVVILTDPERPNTAWERLAAAVTLAGGPERLLGTNASLLKASVQTAYGTLEEVMNPEHPNRGVLVVRGGDPGTLLATTRAITEVGRIEVFAGNAVVLPVEGGARVLDVAPRKAIGSMSFETRARTWLTDAWPLIGVTVPLAAFLSAWLIARWARARGGRA